MQQKHVHTHTADTHTHGHTHTHTMSNIDVYSKSLFLMFLFAGVTAALEITASHWHFTFIAHRTLSCIFIVSTYLLRKHIISYTFSVCVYFDNKKAVCLICDIYLLQRNKEHPHEICVALRKPQNVFSMNHRSSDTETLEKYLIRVRRNCKGASILTRDSRNTRQTNI